MVPNRAIREAPAHPSPSERRKPAPEGHLEGAMGADRALGIPECERLIQAVRLGIYLTSMGRDRVEYRVLRKMGAGPEEALAAILGLALDGDSRSALLAMTLPERLPASSLQALIRQFDLDPEQVAGEFDSPRRAKDFLRRLGGRR